MHSWISHIHWGAFVLAFNSAIRSLQLPYHKTFKFAVSYKEVGFALKGLLTSSPLPSVVCMYQSVLLELHIFGFCYFRLCCCVPPSAHASLAQLVISGCIRIEGSVASSLLGFSVDCMYQSILLGPYIFWTRCFRLRCGVFTCAHLSRSL
jgi:hypothetical protein